MTINSVQLQNTFSATLGDDANLRAPILNNGQNAAPHVEFSKLLQPKPVAEEKLASPKLAVAAANNITAEPAIPARELYARQLNGNEGAESAQPVQGTQDFSLSDVIDIINPLQHIPVLGSIYRAVTGDELSGAARVIGGIAFGGPMGALIATSNAIYAQEHGGKDFGENMIAQIGDDDEMPQTPQQLAEQDNNQERSDSATDVADESINGGDAAAVNLAEVPDDISAQPWLRVQPQSYPATPVEQEPLHPADIVPNKPMRGDAVTPHASEQKPVKSTSPAASAAPIAPEQMPEYMMRALDKYEQMIKQRQPQ